MAVVTDFVADVFVGLKPFTVQFTDTSTGSPDGWLWDFGDGFFSEEENPIHVYRSEGVFTVTLKSFLIDSTIAAGTIQGDIAAASESVDSTTAGTYNTFDDAQTAFNATLPFSDWTGSVVQMQYQILDHHINNKWDFRGSRLWRNFKLASILTTTDIVYLRLKLAGVGQVGVIKHHHYNDIDISTGKYIPFALKVGKWNGSFDGNENQFDLDFLNYNPSEFMPILDLESFFGIAGEQTFSLNDAYSWEKLLVDPLPYTGGTRDYAGYGTSGGLGSFTYAAYRTLAGNKDSETKVNYITANENVIVRPPVLFSGIKEAYFKDGWENEKHLYIEQTNAQPCTIQFVDVYAETENEE